MVFSSYEFLLHLAVFWLGFGLLRMLGGGRGVAWWVALYLLVISGWIYAWRGWSELVVLGGSIVANRLLGGWVSESRAEWVRAWGVRVGVVGNLALLGWFKYRGLLVWPEAGVTGAEVLFLPLGISFFTFQQVGYLVDCGRGKGGRHGWVEYGVFVSFFPQLVAGPIVRHGELIPQLRENPARRIHAEWVARGLALLGFGLAKKVFLADGLAPFVDAGFAQTAVLSAPEAWLVMTAYACQLYFDFSGYCDMAVGLGLMFGLRLPLNFESPFRATNLVDFWRRWNLTLGAFFRDYLFKPLGGFGRSAGRRGVVLLLTMMLVGLWHGSTWAFAAWGLLHGAGLLVARGWRTWGRPLPSVVGVGLTFGFVVVSMVFFRAGNWGEAMTMYGAMFGGDWGWPHFLPGADWWTGGRTVVWFVYLKNELKEWYVLLLAGQLVLIFGFKNTNEVAGSAPLNGWLAVRVAGAWLLGLMCLGEVREFVYFVF